MKDNEAGTVPVPLTVLTGFLGAGKTTLLNRILGGDHGLRIAIIVNDFGSVNIDAELVVEVDGNTISLSNGCVCCEIRDDLVDCIGELITRTEDIDYIVLEASGIADPAGIFLTFNDESLRDEIRLDSVTCVVDADQLFAYPDYPELMDLKLRQVGYADMVILNKVTLAGAARTQRAREWLDQHFNRLRVVETDDCVVPLEILIGAVEANATGTGQGRDGRLDRWRSHNSDDFSDSSLFGACTWETERPLDVDRLRAELRSLPGSIFRVKGIVHVANEPERRYVVQAVGRRIAITSGELWGHRPRRSQIVAIGHSDSSIFATLDSRLSLCVANP